MRRWAFAWAWSIGVVLLVSCNLIPKPPNPSPSPTIEPTAEPTVEPTAPPTAEPTAPPTTPPPTTSCHPAPDAAWGKPKPATLLLYPEYKAVVDSIGDTCGQAAADEKPQRASLDRIASVWRQKYPGRCVSSPGDWGGEGDNVSVRNPQTGDYTEVHAIYFGNGCTIVGANAFRADWPCPGCVPGTPATPPPATPPPTAPPPNMSGCSAPIPPKVDRWGLKAHNAWYDSTPLFYNRDSMRWDGSMSDKFCDNIGFTNRLHCPARMECEEGKDNFKCGERRACEGVGIGNDVNANPLFRCSNGEPEINSSNPFQARCSAESTWIEACAVDGTGCTRVSL